MAIHHETLIIGAGPAGLAIAGRMRKKGLPFHIIEAADKAGNSWHEHYERVHLHTIKQYSHLPHLPFPASAPRYVPRQQVADYLGNYAEHFDIQPEFNQTVSSARKTDSGWEVHTATGSAFTCGNLIMCTGVNRKPVLPVWPGKESFPGDMIHSKAYRNAKPYQGEKVLVVGMGNTGAEIALDLCEQGVEVALSVRGSVNIVLRDTLGNPIQRTSMMLGKLPVSIGDPIGRFLAKLTVGDLSKYGLHRRDMAPSKQLRTLGKTPVIDVGTVKQIKKGKIKVFPGIRSSEEKTLQFADGQEASFDAIVLATGYTASVTDVVDGIEPMLNEHGNPTGLWSDQFPGLYFLGFDPYSSGILLGIYRDSEKIVEHLTQHA